MEQFSVFLKNRRVSMKLTQWELAARMLGIEGLDARELSLLVESTAKKISHWECGDSMPKCMDIRILKTALDCTYEDIFELFDA